MDNEEVEIGIIGGTGVYEQELMDDLKELKVYTPYGQPSDLISVGYYKNRRIAFLPRHGKSHQYPPHKIPFRANIWAFKELGIRRVIAASAVGSLQKEYKPSEFVILDQFIDRTKDRQDTFYDGGQICHVSVADPFCPELREIFIHSVKDLKLPIHERGTYVCCQGPRFSTRAESKLFRSWGADVVGMTLFPEVVLAREVGMCYSSVAMITDYDVWADTPVTIKEVVETMKHNVAHFRRVIMETIPKIPRERSCPCKDIADEAIR